MSFRFDRANKEIQRCISIIIQTKMNDPRIDPLLYVSDVNLTADFKYCKVKIALDSDDHNKLQNMLEILKKSEGFIKRELADMVKMPSIPKLIFELDKGTSATIRVNEILKSLNIPKTDESGENDE